MSSSEAILTFIAAVGFPQGVGNVLTNIYSPTPVSLVGFPGGTTITRIAASSGAIHVCFLLSTNQVACAGDNAYVLELLCFSFSLTVRSRELRGPLVPVQNFWMVQFWDDSNVLGTDGSTLNRLESGLKTTRGGPNLTESWACTGKGVEAPIVNVRRRHPGGPIVSLSSPIQLDPTHRPGPPTPLSLHAQ